MKARVHTSTDKSLERTDREYKRSLLSTLQLLQDSAELFDSGKKRHAQSMSIQLRILFHNQGMNHSLIQSVFDRKILRISSPNPSQSEAIYIQYFAPGYPENIESTFVTCRLCDYHSDPKVPDLQAKAKTGAQYEKRGFLPLKQWWENEVVLLLPRKDCNGQSVTYKTALSRKDIVLMVADQDGGAHVDPVLSKELVLLKRNELFRLSIDMGGTIKTVVLEDLLYAAIRTIAEETLQTFCKVMEKLLNAGYGTR